jgi:hypothetical protein
MLDACAPGWWMKDKTHKRWVYAGDRESYKLPRGPHGKRQRYGIEMGHIKGMIRHFDIEDCAKKHLRQL